MRDSRNVELALIGSALLAPHILDEVAVPKEAFAYPAHRAIWDVIITLHESGETVDPIIVEERLPNYKDILDKLLQEHGFASAHYKQYADEVIELWQFRKIHRISIDLIDQVNAGQKSPHEIVDYGINELEAVVDVTSTTSDGEAIIRSDDIVDDVVELVESGGDIGLSTGFPSIDKYFTLSKGSFIILAARPGMGKTALADQIAENVALGGSAVLFVSMEMPAQELTIRRLARRSQVPISFLRRGQLDDDMRQAVELAKEEIKQLKTLYIYDNSSANMQQIGAIARKIARKHNGIALIVIDYIQQMIEGGVEGNTVQEMTAIARSAKVLARKLDTTVLALSQLSRSVEIRKDKRPQLADLRESGGLEQAADVVAFIFRKAYYESNPDPEEARVAEILIRKNRQGPVGVTYLRFDSPYAKFYE